MDSFHHYLLHLFQCGFRITKANDNGNDDDPSDHDYDVCYDPEFARINNIISSTQSSTERFNRVSSGDKFNIEASDAAQSMYYDDNDDGDNITYSDTVYQHLHVQKIKEDVIVRLETFLNAEEYDTESIGLDLKIFNGNIYQHMINDEQCMDAIMYIFNQSQRMFDFTFCVDICMKCS